MWLAQHINPVSSLAHKSYPSPSQRCHQPGLQQQRFQGSAPIYRFWLMTLLLFRKGILSPHWHPSLYWHSLSISTSLQLPQHVPDLVSNTIYVFLVYPSLPPSSFTLLRSFCYCFSFSSFYITFINLSMFIGLIDSSMMFVGCVLLQMCILLKWSLSQLVICIFIFSIVYFFCYKYI